MPRQYFLKEVLKESFREIEKIEKVKRVPGTPGKNSSLKIPGTFISHSFISI
jgi:hypothetical protein